MNTTSVPGELARAMKSSSRASWPETTVTWDEMPRCVIGMPAEAGTAESDETPGTISNGTPAAASASASSPPPPKTNGSPPLRRTTTMPEQHVVSAPLAEIADAAGALDPPALVVVGDVVALARRLATHGGRSQVARRGRTATSPATWE